MSNLLLSQSTLRSFCITAALTTVVSSSTGCLERLFPDAVAEGVSRLTVRQAGTILSAINADTNCGFASEGVIAAGKSNVARGLLERTPPKWSTA